MTKTSFGLPKSKGAKWLITLLHNNKAYGNLRPNISNFINLDATKVYIE